MDPHAVAPPAQSRAGLAEKKLDWTVEQKRAAIEPADPKVSLVRQCELLGLARSSYYYASTGESAENLELLRWLDEQYTRAPFFGVRRMTAAPREAGYTVSPKRGRRLLRLLGLEAVMNSGPAC